MKLSKFKQILQNSEHIQFVLPGGGIVPEHFHVTEVGKVTKHFIDCGGSVRKEEVVNFQLWASVDYDHRLFPEKLNHIIELSERVLELEDLEIEVEYQGETIEKFGIDHNGRNFVLTTRQTDCLAKEKCEIPVVEKKISSKQKCSPLSGCC